MDILELYTKSVDKSVNNVDNFLEKIIYLVFKSARKCINKRKNIDKQIFRI